MEACTKFCRQISPQALSKTQINGARIRCNLKLGPWEIMAQTFIRHSYLYKFRHWWFYSPIVHKESSRMPKGFLKYFRKADISNIVSSNWCQVIRLYFCYQWVCTYVRDELLWLFSTMYVPTYLSVAIHAKAVLPQKKIEQKRGKKIHTSILSKYSISKLLQLKYYYPFIISFFARTGCIHNIICNSSYWLVKCAFPLSPNSILQYKIH